MKNSKTLILIDDDEIIVYLTKRLVAQTNLIGLNGVFRNGKEAIEYLTENAQNIDLLLVLLNLIYCILHNFTR